MQCYECGRYGLVDDHALLAHAHAGLRGALVRAHLQPDHVLTSCNINTR